jgi:hypothetical protein
MNCSRISSAPVWRKMNVRQLFILAASMLVATHPKKTRYARFELCRP